MKKELLIGMVGTTLLLGACGNSTENSDNEKNKDAKKVEEKKEVAFGELFNNGKRITYKLENDDEQEHLTKNSDVTDYYVTDNGKITSYKAYDTTLKELNGKSDSEIIEMAKEQDKKYFEKSKKDTIEGLESNIEMAKKNLKTDEALGIYDEEHEKNKDSITNNQKNIEVVQKTKYEKPKERKVKIKAVEDETGNYTDEERFFIVAHKFDYPDDDNKIKFVNDDDELSKYYIAFKKSAPTIKIYDDNYAFLMNEQDKYLATKVSDKAKVSTLDKLKSKYVTKND